MKSELMVFEGNNVEVIELNGKVLFNPKDVAKCLGIKNVNDNITKMNEKQVIKLKNSDIGKADFRKLNNAGENFLTESGVYKLIFKSHKEEAERFQDWVTDEVLPQIRQTGGYIPTKEEESDEEFLARALLVAQRTLEKKNKELEEKNKIINQIETSENSLLVREVAKIASKNGIKTGEKRLYNKLREWGLIFKNSREPKQEYVERGYFEIVETVRETKGKTFTDRTTKVTGKGQIYIIKRLLKENE